MLFRASYEARRLCGALLLSLASVSPPTAQENSPFGDPDERQQQLEPPLPLPEGSIGIIRPQPDAEPVLRINTIRQVFQAIEACWKRPSGRGYSGQELTIRMSFKRNGEVLGKPRITYYKAGAQTDQRESYTRSVQDAFERCTPLPFTDSLGAAVAGRPFIFRFIDSRPM